MCQERWLISLVEPETIKLVQTTLGKGSSSTGKYSRLKCAANRVLCRLTFLLSVYPAINASQQQPVKEGFGKLFVWKRLVLVLINVLRDRLNLHGHVRHMDIDKVSLACPVPKLSQCLNEGHTLDIADRATLADGKSSRRIGEGVSEQIARPFLACGHIPIRLAENPSVKMLFLRCSGIRHTDTHIRFLS
jgi:hypothetical protein